MPTHKRKPAPKAAAYVVRRNQAGQKKLPATKKGGTIRRPNEVLDLRKSLGLTRKVFSRLLQFSERAIADWEAGEALGGASRQRMTELQRLQQALGTVMEPDFIGEWLQAPNDSFDGLKPLEVIERGQMDRIWRMVYLLESGTPN